MIENTTVREKYKLTTAALLSLRVKARYRGFFYVREIVLLLLNSEETISDDKYYDIKEIIPKALYIDVSKKMSVSIENIEKSIRVAIVRMWENVEPGAEAEILGIKYSFPSTKPTNTQLIHMTYVLVKKILKKQISESASYSEQELD